jgi:hypothetical protein
LLVLIQTFLWLQILFRVCPKIPADTVLPPHFLAKRHGIGSRKAKKTTKAKKLNDGISYFKERNALSGELEPTSKAWKSFKEKRIFMVAIELILVISKI